MDNWTHRFFSWRKQHQNNVSLLDWIGLLPSFHGFTVVYFSLWQTLSWYVSFLLTHTILQIVFFHYFLFARQYSSFLLMLFFWVSLWVSLFHASSFSYLFLSCSVFCHFLYIWRCLWLYSINICSHQNACTQTSTHTHTRAHNYPHTPTHTTTHTHTLTSTCILLGT